MKRRLASKAAAFLFPLFLLSLPLGLWGYSHVRIVRLSFVQGDVYVALPGRADLAPGLANLPLEHDAVIETHDGVAEAEFESEILLRLAPDSRLHLEELGLFDTGERVTHLFLQEGTATFDAHLHRGDTFLIVTPYFQVNVPKKARVRVDVTSAGASVRVFKGRVIVDGDAGAIPVSKGHTFDWDAARADYELTHGLERDDWDDWNEHRDSVLHGRVTYGPSYYGRAGIYYSPYPWGYAGHPYTSCGYYNPYGTSWGWGSSYYYGSSWASWCGSGYTGYGSYWWWPHGGGTVIPSASPPMPTDPDPQGPPPPDEGTDEGEGPILDGDREGAPPFRGRPRLPPGIPDRFVSEQGATLPAIEGESSDGERSAPRRLRRNDLPRRLGAGGREATERAPHRARRAAPSRSRNAEPREATRKHVARRASGRHASPQAPARRPAASRSRQPSPRRSPASARRPSPSRSPSVRSSRPPTRSRAVNRAPRSAAPRRPATRKPN